MSVADKSVAIVAAVRTPVGSFNGALASLPASALGTVALKAAIERAKLDPPRSRRSSWARS